jgi:flagellar biosynthesis/type III secretory pathway M-ring protein FliF/YscJ
LKSPFLIGRVESFSAANKKTTPAGNNWLYYAAGGFVLLSFFITLAQFISRRNAKRHQSQLDKYKLDRSQALMEQDASTNDDATGELEDSRNDADGGFDFRKSS